MKNNLEGKKIISIACGKLFTMVLSNNGNVYSWGINTYGQLGIGNCKNQTHPCLITSLVDFEIGNASVFVYKNTLNVIMQRTTDNYFK